MHKLLWSCVKETSFPWRIKILRAGFRITVKCTSQPLAAVQYVDLNSCSTHSSSQPLNNFRSSMLVDQSVSWVPIRTQKVKQYWPHRVFGLHVFLDWSAKSVEGVLAFIRRLSVPALSSGLFEKIIGQPKWGIYSLCGGFKRNRLSSDKPSVWLQNCR